MADKIVDYFATHRSKGTLSPPPQDLSTVRCEDKGTASKPFTASGEHLAFSDSEPIEMYERQKLSKYLDRIHEDYGTCPPVIPIAGKFKDSNDGYHYITATAWAFGVHHLFTCYHVVEEKKDISDSSTGNIVPVQLEKIYQADPLDPRRSFGELEIVYTNSNLDIAILRSRELFHRLVLQNNQPLYYSKLYTVQISNVPHPIVHPGRYYPSPLPSTFLTDARSTSRFSGSPVLTAGGHVIGMLREEWSDINAMVVSTEGLLMALEEIGGGEINWKQWGVKGCLGYAQPSPALPPQPPLITGVDTRLLRALRHGRDIDKWKTMLEEVEKAKEYDRYLRQKLRKS
ncbi:hypothetical protein TWF694_004958 [Orbilia ellipsospora]|uniref:Trypsin-like serine protease n=1 Tax=Orbilia ellipsospora TaxID=2528407 RepID=A0AAV9WWN2_9PEZI